jgi:hypothetical protein
LIDENGREMAILGGQLVVESSGMHIAGDASVGGSNAVDEQVSFGSKFQQALNERSRHITCLDSR